MTSTIKHQVLITNLIQLKKLSKFANFQVHISTYYEKNLYGHIYTYLKV